MASKEHLSHDEFFSGLSSLLDKHHSSGHGSIWITQKRLTHGFFSPDSTSHDSFWDLNPPHPLPILIRATDGKSRTKDLKKNADKVKLSTVIQPDDLASFYTRYADTCKAGMQSLKKRDRKGRKKAKKGKVEKK